MTITITILSILFGFIALLLFIALFMKKEHYVKSEIIINVSKQKVYDFLKFLKNQDKFNKWAKADPDRNWEYKGEDGTIGFIISWKGNKKAGEGAKEIMNLTEGKRIETQIRFVKPMVMVSNIVMETETITGPNNQQEQTKVTMSNAGTINYPMNLMIPIAEKMFPKDMDESLNTLKNILEA